MNFDYYFKKYDEEYGFNDSELCGFEIGFEVGQQSKQEEVNKLQKEIDALKAKIDLALTQVSNHYQSCVARKNLKQMSAPISEISEIEVHELNMQTLERILKGE